MQLNIWRPKPLVHLHRITASDLNDSICSLTVSGICQTEQTWFQELTDRKETTYSAGGATQNSIRFAQWLLQAPGSSTYIGSIGKDKYGDILRESMDKAGVRVSSSLEKGLVCLLIIIWRPGIRLHESAVTVCAEAVAFVLSSDSLTCMMFWPLHPIPISKQTMFWKRPLCFLTIGIS